MMHSTFSPRPARHLFALTYVFLLVLTGFGFTSCGGGTDATSEAIMPEVSSSDTVAVRSYGQTPDGPTSLYTLRNANGMEVDVTNYGGIITAIRVPDRKGNVTDVTLGFSNLDGYLADNPYFGALIGRYGNRIAQGRFSLDGKDYELAQNDGDNTLHGGPKGFHRQLYTVETIDSKAGAMGISLTRTSSDGEEGYPGNLDVTVRYLLNDDNELRIEYGATTDAPTVVNLTNHAYFNLGDEATILKHELMIDAAAFTPVDGGLIPTGELRDVEGTPFDFRDPTAIGARIDDKNQQLARGKGYDHNWVLDRDGDGLESVATLYAPSTGRMMEVLTTEPGLQFYSGNFLDGSLTGRDGTAYVLRSGLCLETQHFPDSPNQPEFPSTELRPGEKYSSATVYRFSVR